MKKKHQIIENITALFTLKLVDLGLMVWLIPYLISVVGFYNYGHYVLAMSLALFFVNVLNYGFNLATVRELAKHKENTSLKINNIFNEVFSVKLFLMVILYVLFIGISFGVPKFSEHFYVYGAASFILFGDLFSLRWFFMGVERMKFITLIHLFGTLMFVGLVLWLVKEASDYKNVPVYEALSVSLVNIVGFLWVLKVYKIKLRLISIEKIIIYLKLNFSSFINLLLPSTLGILIVFLTGLLGNPLAVGVMQIGVKFTGAFTTLNTILTNVFYPLVNRNNHMEITTRKILNILGCFVSVAMFFSAEFLITHWLHFETKEREQVMVLIIKVLSPVPILSAIVSSYGVNGMLTKYQDKLFGKITIVALCTMFVLSVILVPGYLELGAAIAFVLARCVYGGTTFYYFKKNRYVG